VGVPLEPELKAIPIGESELLRDGEDALVVAFGNTVHPAVEAAGELAADGTSVAVVNARFAKPIDAARIVPLARRCAAVVTVEEQAGQAGFGSAVLETLAEAGVAVRARILAVPDRVVDHGNSADQRAAFGLDPAGIAKAVRELVGGSGSS
jgi:1-deoxy-D-xylulose-5-phosphate synthase